MSIQSNSYFFANLLGTDNKERVTELALAETTGNEMPEVVTFEWEMDVDHCNLPENWSWKKDRIGQFRPTAHYVEVCFLYVAGECVASVGSITDADDNQRRLVQAEMLLEYLNEIQGK